MQLHVSQHKWKQEGGQQKVCCVTSVEGRASATVESRKYCAGLGRHVIGQPSVSSLSATKRVRGVPKPRGGHTKLPTWAFGELPMGYETCEGCAEIEAGTHTKPPTWAFGELPMGYETCEECAEIEAGTTYGTAHLGLR